MKTVEERRRAATLIVANIENEISNWQGLRYTWDLLPKEVRDRIRMAWHTRVMIDLGRLAELPEIPST